MKKFILLFAAGLILVGCTKENGTRQNLEESFDYATVKAYSTEIDFGTANTIAFQVFTQDPTTEDDRLNPAIKAVYKGFTGSNGKFSGEIPIPIDATMVYVYTDHVKVADGLISAAIGNSISVRSAKSQYVNVRSADYTIPDVLLDMVNTHFIEGQALKATHPDLFDASVYKNTLLTTQDDTEITAAFLMNKGSFHNIVGYYFYPEGSSPDFSAKHVLFANTKTAALSSTVMLKYTDALGNESTKFPRGIRVGFYMTQDGADGCYTPQLGHLRTFYSHDEQNENSARQMIVIDGNDRNTKIIAMEDLNSGPYADYDFNDVVIVVNANAALNDRYTIDPTPAIVEFGGTMAFEDLWPYEGDYDINDVVLEFNSKVYLNLDNKATRIEECWRPVFKGAGPGYTDGFGCQYGVAMADVKSVEWSSNQAKPQRFDVNANCVENGQGLLTVMFFDNVREFGGLYFITGSPEYNVAIDFNSPRELASVTPPNNPFITVKISTDAPSSLRREVHLTGYQPTALIDPTYLGYGHDDSDPAKGRYYVNSGNLPWAIYIPGEYGVINVNEKKSMLEIYPNFVNWVASKGTTHKNWFR